MIDRIFDCCVDLLRWLAGATGTTYKQINVLIFCVIWPLFTIAIVALCLVQRAQVKRLRRQSETGKQQRHADSTDA